MAGRESEVKECWYSILGVARTSSAEEIRSAYRKEALKWHPDKIQQSGASARECQAATVRFQSISKAYEVLSDPTERAWYDKYRSEILSSSGGGGGAAKDFEFNVFSFFSPSAFSGFGSSGRGFYKVYHDVFADIHKKEQAFARAHGDGPIGEAPSIGVATSPLSDVEDFYRHWTAFSTVKDFSWCDEYRLSEAPNRRVRRLMEEENAKIRKRERREYNDSVRNLANFVKKRDKRWSERQAEVLRMQKEKEMQFRLRKQQLKNEKIARIRAVQEQEDRAAGLANRDGDEDAVEDADEGSYGWQGGKKVDEIEQQQAEEFYCVVCSKRFRSEKQWQNHEKSKKHIDAAAALKRSILEEDEELDGLASDAEDDSTVELETGGAPGSGPSRGEEVAESFGREDEGASDHSSVLDDVRGGFEEDPHRECTTAGANDGKEGTDSEGDEEGKTLEEDDEESMLADMIKLRDSRLAADSGAAGGRDEDRPRPDEGGKGAGAGGSPPDSDGEPAFASTRDDDAGDGDDEDSMLASMLQSRTKQSRFSPGERGSGSGDSESDAASAPEEEIGPSSAAEVGEDVLSGNPATGSTGRGRRRSKGEREHMSAQDRYGRLAKELSRPSTLRFAAPDGGAEELRVEDSWLSHPVMNAKKKALQRGQKKGKPDSLGKQGTPSPGQVVGAVSQQSENLGKKGSARQKKGKGSSKS